MIRNFILNEVVVIRLIFSEIKKVGYVEIAGLIQI